MIHQEEVTSSIPLANTFEYKSYHYKDRIWDEKYTIKAMMIIVTSKKCISIGLWWYGDDCKKHKDSHRQSILYGSYDDPRTVCQNHNIYQIWLPLNELIS